MEQKNTEQTIKHTEDEQNTGNHKKPGAPDAGGADAFGGTRTGSDNVEDVATPKQQDCTASSEPGCPAQSVFRV